MTKSTSQTSPIRAVLDHYGAVIPSPKGDKWLPMRCPFHGDEQASAAVNEVAGRFICHGCMRKSEDAIGLIQWWEECGYGPARERCESIVGGSIDPVRERSAKRGPSGLSQLFG